MNHNLILERLHAISQPEWKIIIRKCYSHLKIKLCNKTASGAHSEKRLGVEAKDFYFGEAITALYRGTWEWKYETFQLAEQIIRIMDSMISEQVRKYTVENKQGKALNITGGDQLMLSLEDISDFEDDHQYLEKYSRALTMVCAENKTYYNFVLLKRNGASYTDICQKIKCTPKEAYKLMENISKRANKILFSL